MACAPLVSDFGRASWRQLGDGTILKPELPWEKQCIEAPSVMRRGDTLVMFYAGGYNNDPQQIGATSRDDLVWTRLTTEPLVANGRPGTWNSSESGHPGIFEDEAGRTYLFYQGNARDGGKSWYLSCLELEWDGTRPKIKLDSKKFPVRR